ncbi:MAG: hypothetical protein GY863_08860 [bacterium]|nr:hypothetical protein [bacterium]
MKIGSLLSILLLSVCIVSFCGRFSEDIGNMNIDYFGQEPPGDTPELFLPGIISTNENNEFGGHFSPDGKQFFFTRSVETVANIMICKYKEGKWTTPEKIEFSGGYEASESCISPDGRKLVFMSFRPSLDNYKVLRDYDFWISEYTGNEWQEPSLLAENIDLGPRRVSPSLSLNGNLYFSGDRDEPGQKDIYLSRFINGNYTVPENLGPTVNSESDDSHVYIAPDESYILFDSHRPGEFEKTNIYISFKSENGNWSKAVILNETINSEYSDWYPTVTPDGKYILFSQNKGNSVDIYWGKADIIEQLKNSFQRD